VVREQHEAARRGESREFEARVVTKQGEVRWLHTHIQGLHRDGVLRMVGASRDITEARRAEEERRALDQHMREVQRLESLGVLAGGIAHDFNNLLSVIQGGNSALAIADLDPEAPVQQRLKRIRSAAEHAAGLTEQMLTYSGNAGVTLKPLTLSSLVESVLVLLEASVSKQTTLQTRLARDLPLVEGDETQLRQVVVNLVTNASEALEGAPGRVCVETGTVRASRAYLSDAYSPRSLPEGDHVYLEVSDTGVGIEEAARARIFEPFFTTKRSGRGLGLAAVLGIVQSHHGALKLTSEVGQGTRFRVLLPLTQSRPGDGGPSSKAPSDGRDEGPAQPRGYADHEEGT
jgi:signal transduction histidine kinase